MFSQTVYCSTLHEPNQVFKLDTKQMYMKFSTADKVIRLTLGISGIAVFVKQLLINEIAELACGIIGLILIITVLIDFCPLYYILGIKKVESQKKDRFY